MNYDSSHRARAEAAPKPDALLFADSERDAAGASGAEGGGAGAPRGHHRPAPRCLPRRAGQVAAHPHIGTIAFTFTSIPF